MDAKQRLKILIDSSSPIVLIETLEEARALRLIQQAAAELELPVFEWSIADGLSRSAKSAHPFRCRSPALGRAFS